MCEYEQLPLYKWFSSSDQTGALPGLVCFRVDDPPPGETWKSWTGLWKLARLVEGFPWE